jgi:DNA-binding NarL/FixJ family response regulator
MNRLFILDSSPIFIMGLKSIIHTIEDCNVIVATDNIDELLLKEISREDSLFLVDLDIQSQSALDTIRVIKEHYLHAKIIGLSKLYNKEELMGIVRSGVNGLLIKSCEPAEVIRAIDMVKQGQDYFAKPVVELIINNYAKSNPEVKDLIKKDQFSKREMEIIKLICQQKTAKEIGKIIFVCEKTVDFHRHKIIDKMNVRNIIGLVVFAIKNGLVKVEEI